METQLEPIDVLPIRMRVVTALRQAILSGEYAEGQELSLTEIAAQLGVSRTPVREAFQMLEQDDLITLRMNRGAVVKGIDAEVIRDHYETRKLLEGETIFRAVVRGFDTQYLRQLQAKIEKESGSISSKKFAAYNNRFHNDIWQAAESRKLLSFLVGLWNGSSFGKTVNEKEHQRLSIAEHAAMLTAMERGDAEGARREMEQHITRSMQNILDSYGVK